MNTFKRRSLLLMLSFIIFISSAGMASDCDAGGPGSSGCTFRSTVSVFGVSLWSVEGSSVSGCDDGTYACCTASSASCVPEEDGNQTPTIEE